ncbi:MAG: hypothetical protein ACOX1V_02345 [Candidatus Iainarchaeum sp.]
MAFIIVSVIFSIFYFSGIVIILNDNLFLIMLQIIIAFLAVIVTILTILYAISDFIADNPFIVELKKRGLYNQMFDRFLDSIKAVFTSSIVIFILYVIMNTKICDNNILLELFFSLLVLIIFFFSIVRTYRCFKVLQVLHGIISHEPNKKLQRI